MLLTVQGGGFFRSSVSGYSKGLTLLLGKKHEDRPMRVSPWNHYQLVDQESDSDLNQLASIKNRLSRGMSCRSLVLDKTNDHTTQLDDGNSNVREIALKSSLKKRPINSPPPLEDVNDHEASGEKYGDIPSQLERRKVQWMDACGSELAEIREFEPSETSGSDDEFDDGNEGTCSCTIM
ncbi:hypothetical protein F3Y22_tig00005294pilonHSYRG00053 [Hibiscus syriacus]|uniref:Uncharacterized protein n=1 Tax=Hibiscus syriacus TaxID=106335 RepID=A0A6A3CGG7_HIBSY|nr:hypothetical protein F3Y22_tig00005294pilonHSYRG00053 [Hibiscus syriacus]